MSNKIYGINALVDAGKDEQESNKCQRHPFAQSKR